MHRLFPLALLLCLTAAASAQTPRDDAARALKEARRLHDVRDYETALAKYEEVERLLPAARIDVLVAATLEALGRTVEAAERLERAIRRSKRAADSAQERLARRRLDALLRNVSSVRVRCDVPGATVLLDGSAIGEVPIEKRIYLAPGSHRLRVRAQGRRAFDRTLVLYPGDHTIVTVELAPAGSGSPRGRGDGPPRPRRRVWSWVALAGAGAALGVGLGIGAWGQSQYNDYSATKDPLRYDELREAIPWKQHTANALFGVSGALAAAAIVLFIVEGRSVESRRAQIIPTGTGLSVSTRF
jgi:tetratricopeptide (TPR) repeat protein